MPNDKWPAERIALIADAAEDLSTVIGLAYNEFSINAGWEGERPEKQALHDAAIQEVMA